MDLKLPHLGEGADSGTVVNLFVKEGDQVAKDQPVLELENEKAVATIPSTGAGTVSKIYIKPGDKISVGQRILSLGEAGAAEPKPAQKSEPAPQKPAEPKPAATASREPEPEPAGAAAEPKADVPVAAAPSLRKLARDLGIDLTKVRGSARGGRIVLDDIRSYIQRLQRLAAQPPASAGAGVATQSQRPPPEQIDFTKWGSVLKKPLTPLRQVIARRMVENWNAIPHVTQFDDVDVTELNALRKKYAPAYEQKGTRLTLTSFVLKIVADVLKQHPIFNSSLDEVAQEIILKEYVHIGVAVDTDAGLIVPVIRDVDKKSILEISRDLEEIAKKARDRKVSAEQLKGGTFTISNQGGIGGAHFTPIINKPEVAILGLGRSANKPMVRGDKIESRLMMPIGLSYDHRVIDGGQAARFVVDLLSAFQSFKESIVKL